MRPVCNNIGGKDKARATATAVINEQPETEELVEKAAAGNIEAFGQLYSIYLDRIYRYIFYQVKDKMTAEDITEEVFVKAWTAIGSCKGKSKTFSSWLYRIAHNHLINTLRSLQRYKSIEMDNLVDISNPGLEAEARLEHRELIEKISYLPQNQKQVIILKFIEGMDNREAGRIMSKSEGAIRIIQMRALSTLRQNMCVEKIK